MMLEALILIVALQVPPVKNPTAIEFSSPDHAQLSGYEVDIRLDSDDSLVQTLNIAPPDPLPSGTIRLTLNVQPVKFGSYHFVVRAIAGGLESDNSPASDRWDRVPGPPSKPVVK